jgi:hypothetical protein
MVRLFSDTWPYRSNIGGARSLAYEIVGSADSRMPNSTGNKKITQRVSLWRSIFRYLDCHVVFERAGRPLSGN